MCYIFYRCTEVVYQPKKGKILGPSTSSTYQLAIAEGFNCRSEKFSHFFFCTTVCYSDLFLQLGHSSWRYWQWWAGGTQDGQHLHSPRLQIRPGIFWSSHGQGVPCWLQWHHHPHLPSCEDRTNWKQICWKICHSGWLGKLQFVKCGFRKSEISSFDSSSIKASIKT